MGCLIALGFAGLCGAAAYVGLLQQGFDAQHAQIGAGIAAFLGLGLSGFLSSARQAAKERRQLSRSQLGEMPEDGSAVTVTGRAYPLSAPLTAPFSGTPCIAYEYRITRVASDEETSEVNGLALCPSALRTLGGELRLLAWMPLDHFPERVLDTAQDRARARRYLSAARFESISLATPGRLWSTLKDMLTDDDGSIRKDFRMGRDELLLEGRRLWERVVPVGADVRAVGLYSAERQGLVSALSKGVTLQLSPGDTQAAMSGAARRVWSNLVGGLVMVAVLGGAAYFGLSLSRGQDVKTARAQALDELLSAAKDGDVRRAERALTSGADADALGKGGLTALMLAHDAAIVRLLTTRGAHVDAGDEYGVTPLMQAARAGRADVVRALLDAGAGVDARTRSGRTALDHAREAGRQEVVRILEAARR